MIKRDAMELDVGDRVNLPHYRTKGKILEVHIAPKSGMDRGDFPLFTVKTDKGETHQYTYRLLEKI